MGGAASASVDERGGGIHREIRIVIVRHTPPRIGLCGLCDVPVK